MKPYGLSPTPFFSLDNDPPKGSRTREKRAAARLLALEDDGLCSCGCDDYDPGDDGGPDCPCCDTPKAYREPMFVTLAEVARVAA